MMNTRGSIFSRKAKLRVAQGVAAAAVIGLALTGCSSSSDTSSSSDSGTKSLGEATIQLSWIKNAEFMGEFMADSKGYYTDAGFTKVSLTPGPSAVEPVVISNKALMGMGNAISTGTVIASEGAPIKIIGTTYQKNPFTILSLKAHGNISTVDEMKGKTIGVQASNLNLWEAFLKINNLKDTDVKMVPVEYDPTPLFNGEVDGWFSYLTNETLDAEIKGLDPVTLPLADNGLPFVAETFTATDDAIKNKRDELKGLLIAEIKGWTAALKDPDAAAKYTVDTYGKDLGLTLEKETKQAEVQANDLVVSPDTVKNGLFTISKTLQDQSITTLAAAGIDLTADQLFDMSLLTEVYKEHPELVDYAK
ncbi:ABC transporter substrate-binding protein [Glaciihabitans sp. dw_435]|uniref:ABC transporter substrate-binding protein n=1 Tax=Glaciihabitans sp. dw_435 TaxID=2720081 RepID=UPI0021081DE0|nr:ABC transporter substrate-binding protein [Glaciihabitans sp. dw_435]